MPSEPVCDCDSYNWDAATGKPNVLLEPPDWLMQMRADAGDSAEHIHRPVAIDACIGDAVGSLWMAGYVTLGSCCGHGRPEGPSLVLGNDERDYAGIRSVLADVDGRSFELVQWQLVRVPVDHCADEPVGVTPGE